jgi:hypothetical protein
VEHRVLEVREIQRERTGEHIRRGERP